jgi:hypothetical protein
MDELRSIVSDLVGIFTTLGGIYFFVGFVVNLAQAQVASVTGDTLGRARALQQGITTVILLCIALSVGSISSSIVEYYQEVNSIGNPGTREAVIGFWGNLASLIVTAVTGISITILTVSAVFSGLGLQISKLIGLPIGIARSAGNLITILIGLALSIAAISIARTILDAVMELAL